MIAIVILGLGLLVVATMFPIAWTRTRDLAEFTTSTTCTDAAEATVRMLTSVSKDLNGNGTYEVGTDGLSSFLGDVNAGGFTDPWVHALDLENISADVVWTTGPPPLVDDFVSEPSVAGPDPDPDSQHPSILAGSFPRVVQVAFQDRVYPPLPVPPDVSSTAAEITHWKELLRQRRFSWSVLHKLDYANPPTLDETRTLTMYFVTLRRVQETHRYARQDPTLETVPEYVFPGDVPSGTVAQPQALGADEDVLFPVPWRVQIAIVDATGEAETIGLPGVPAEALANRGAAASSNRLVPEMMPRGAFLIDERSGIVYRVAKREFDPTHTDSSGNLDQAVLTFERDVPYDSLDDDRDGTVIGSDPSELLRTVWVFPPPVQKAPRTGNLPLFVGPQPVVGIELRTMVFSP